MKRRGFLGSLLALPVIGYVKPAGALATLSTRLVRSTAPLPLMTGSRDTFRVGDIITISGTYTVNPAKYRVVAEGLAR